MRNALKIAIAIVFVFAMSVAVFAAEGSLITYKWVDMTEYNEDGSNAYDLTLNIQAVGTEQLRQYRTDITFNNELLIPVSCGDYTTPVELVDGASVDDLEPIWTPEVVVGSGKNKKTYTYDVPDYSWTTSGNKTTLKLTVSTTGFDYFDYSDLDFATVAFKLADGKTTDDIAAGDITIDFIQFFAGQDENGNGIEYGFNEPRMPEPVNFVNEIAPEAPVVEPIYVYVLAGDKVYLQDGSVAVAEAAGDYEVPATVGYVVVNTGYTAQKTYYVDGTVATLVHTNGVVAKDEYSLRDPSQKDKNGEDRSGLRFKMEHATAGRTVANHEIVEVGFIMTAESNKVLAAEGDDYVLDMAMVGREYAKKGYAYNTADGTDFAFDPSDDFNYIITGVFYNVPLTEVKTTIASRPYYKVGETYVYGEITKTTLYDVAVAIKASENWDALSEEQQSYVHTIIAQVDGWTEIVEDEVIIDISDLYD